MAAEFGMDGRWVLELPPETGAEFLTLCGSCVPRRTQLLEQILERLCL